MDKSIAYKIIQKGASDLYHKETNLYYINRFKEYLQTVYEKFIPQLKAHNIIWSIEDSNNMDYVIAELIAQGTDVYEALEQAFVIRIANEDSMKQEGVKTVYNMLFNDIQILNEDVYIEILTLEELEAYNKSHASTASFITPHVCLGRCLYKGVELPTIITKDILIDTHVQYKDVHVEVDRFDTPVIVVGKTINESDIGYFKQLVQQNGV